MIVFIICCAVILHFALISPIELNNQTIIFSATVDYTDREFQIKERLFQLHEGDSFEYELYQFCSQISCNKKMFLELQTFLLNSISGTNIYDKIDINSPLKERYWRESCRRNGKDYGALVIEPSLQLCFGEESLPDSTQPDESTNEVITKLCKEKILVQDEYAVCSALMDLNPTGIAYSFGLYKDTRFEDAMIQSGRHVYSFDPFSAAVDHINDLRNRGELPEALHFFPVGVKRHDNIYTYASSSGAPFNETVHMMRLISIMQQLQHLNTTHISILKIDIEGSEMEVLEDIIDNYSYVFEQIDQICMELHWQSTYVVRPVHETAMILDKTLQYLYQQGFRKYHEMPREGGSRKIICLGNFTALQ